MTESLFRRTAKIASVVTAYWYVQFVCSNFICTFLCVVLHSFYRFLHRIISISMVFLNKYLLSSPDLKVCEFLLRNVASI